MRALALIPALAFPAIMGLSIASSSPPDGAANAQPAKADPHETPSAKPKAHHAKPTRIKLSGNDCAVIAAVAKEHYKFDADHPAPPLKGVASASGKSSCGWSSYGLSFTDWSADAKDGDARDRLKWVEFKKPTYDKDGAVIETSLMAGPLAGTGYSCRLRSGIAGWTVSECKTIWVS